MRTGRVLKRAQRTRQPEEVADSKPSPRLGEDIAPEGDA